MQGESIKQNQNGKDMVNTQPDQPSTGNASENESINRQIRVILADDHALVREGTRRLLEVESDVEVVAEAASGEEAVEAVQRLHPDIAIIDIAMPGIGGIQATREIKTSCPETAILILSAYDITRGKNDAQALNAGRSNASHLRFAQRTGIRCLAFGCKRFSQQRNST